MNRHIIVLMILQSAIFCGEQNESKIQGDQKVKAAIESPHRARALEAQRVLTELNIPFRLVSIVKEYVILRGVDCRFPVSGMRNYTLPWMWNVHGRPNYLWTYMNSGGQVSARILLGETGGAPHSGTPGSFGIAAGDLHCCIDRGVWEVIRNTSQFREEAFIECECRPSLRISASDTASLLAGQNCSDLQWFAMDCYAMLLGKFRPSLIDVGTAEYEEGIAASPYWHAPNMSPQAMLETFERIKKQAFSKACECCKAQLHPLCECKWPFPVACRFVRGFAAAPKNSSNGEPLLLDAIRGIIPGEKTLLLTILS